MIRSIRRFLLISLLLSITVASSITAIGNYLLDKRVIHPYLDEQLIKIYTIIEILTKSGTNQTIQQEIVTHLAQSRTATMQHLLFQVWSPNKKLLIHSPNSATHSLVDIPIGFSDIQLQGNDWRVYAEIDTATDEKIVVAELYDIRNQLINDITLNNAYILLVTYPVFGILIWLIVGLALRSITRVTNEISSRASTYLEPVDIANTPIEIKPLLTELNQLFTRLKLAFDRNKRFAGDAAHELRTPLAALKTQAQVALKADNEADRQSALLKMMQGVDRSSHVVAQLLTLSRLNQEETLNDIRPIDLHKLATEIIAYLAPVALEKNVEIELSSPPNNTMILGNDTALGILIRNIVDNAIRYTPKNGAVRIDIINNKNKIILRVTDTGPGIPVELRERVFERFYRILGTTAAGSGLGLAIVRQIAELHHASISLATPTDGIGLEFNVVFSHLKDQAT